MKKLEKLLELCPDEVNNFIDDLYNKKFPKKNKKTIFLFKVLGKEYKDLVFTKNYIEFIKDVSKIHPYEMFENSAIKSYISKTKSDMKQAHKINDNFYVTSYTSTELKIKHIKDLCDFLGLRLSKI